MGQATRTTKLLIDLGERTQGAANTGKRAYLEETAKILDAARAFFLAYPEKLAERVTYVSDKDQQERERLISPNELLTWAEFQTVETKEHPHPRPDWNFRERFPDMPFTYRRSVIKDAIGKARSYLSNRANWRASGKKKGRPGPPGASNHPTLYAGAFALELDETDLRQTFARLKVYTGAAWQWHNYPVKLSRYFQARWTDPAWEQHSPKLILRGNSAALHFSQVKKVYAKKVKECKQDSHLVTVAVDLNVKNLGVLTEHSNRQLWQHVRRMNAAAADRTSRTIAEVCEQHPGCVLLFERLRKIKRGEASKSRRLNRKQANQVRGQINERSREKAFAAGTVTVEVNPHGTSQYCSRCGAKGERFSYRGGVRVKARWGKLFWCPHCHYEANADFNASVNVHHSFYQEGHWRPREKPPPKKKRSG